MNVKCSHVYIARQYFREKLLFSIIKIHECPNIRFKVHLNEIKNPEQRRLLLTYLFSICLALSFEELQANLSAIWIRMCSKLIFINLKY